MENQMVSAADQLTYAYVYPAQFYNHPAAHSHYHQSHDQHRAHAASAATPRVHGHGYEHGHKAKARYVESSGCADKSGGLVDFEHCEVSGSWILSLVQYAF